MPLLIVVLGIALLLVLILPLKLNSFLAFVIVSLSVALAEGMSLDKAVASIEQGIGSTLGLLVMILGLGAMLGKLVADSGAAERITSRLVDVFGGRVQLALMLTAFIVGVPLFYDVGFVIMMPIVFAVAASAGVPLLYVGLPTLASLSVTHGYLPPHPAPTAIAAAFQADIGKTLLYGIVIAIPAIVVAGPILSRGLKKVNARPLAEFTAAARPAAGSLPGVGTSIVSALLPVLLIGMSTIASYALPASSVVRRILGYAGNPAVAMLVSLLLAIYTLGLARGRTMGDIMGSLTHSISSLTMVMLIIAGAGGLKQVLVDSGVSAYIGQLLGRSPLSPLFLGWLIATILRVCVGSATVAGITTAGIVLPLVTASGVNRELMVLAIGSGSLMLAHVNDGGFWLVKEYFNLSIADTIKTWTLMETAVGVVGLLGVLVLSYVV
jgi:Gnt-I system high-affinity gluconate transporter